MPKKGLQLFAQALVHGERVENLSASHQRHLLDHGPRHGTRLSPRILFDEHWESDLPERGRERLRRGFVDVRCDGVLARRFRLRSFRRFSWRVAFCCGP